MHCPHSRIHTALQVMFNCIKLKEACIGECDCSQEVESYAEEIKSQGTKSTEINIRERERERKQFKLVYFCRLHIICIRFTSLSEATAKSNKYVLYQRSF